MNRPAWTLASVWLGALVVNVLVLLRIHATDAISDGEFLDVLTHLSAIYAPFVAPILMVAFKRRQSRAAPPAFYLALLVSAVWNLLVSYFFFRVWLVGGFIDDSTANTTLVAGTFSWLAAPAIQAYFGKAPADKS